MLFLTPFRFRHQVACIHTDFSLSQKFNHMYHWCHFLRVSFLSPLALSFHFVMSCC
uniref:Uncharacterized protein n=1 Tax=Arundo donax TaxID=35708 RepID=A0A0A9H2S6_ARUDO